MTKKIMKTLAVAMCAVLLVAGSIAGTMAYLTAEKTITNTFTAGKVEITLDESPVGTDGKMIAGDRVAANTYKLVPGRVFDKDPIIHVKAGSEPCYLFVEVVNGISNVEGDTKIVSQMTANGWQQLSGNVYYIGDKITVGDSDVNKPVFSTFTVKSEAKSAEINELDNAKITVTAYAVQAEGFNTAKDAWDATFGA